MHIQKEYKKSNKLQGCSREQPMEYLVLDPQIAVPLQSLSLNPHSQPFLLHVSNMACLLFSLVLALKKWAIPDETH